MQTKKSVSLRFVFVTATLIFITLVFLAFWGFFYSKASNQIAVITKNNSRIILLNIAKTLNTNCLSVIEQISVLMNSNSFNLLQYGILANQDNISPELYIELSVNIDQLFTQNFNIFESFFFYMTDNSILRYMGNNIVKNITFASDYYFSKYDSLQLNWILPDDPPIYTTVYKTEKSFGLLKLLGTRNTKRQGVFLVNIKNSYLTDIVKTQVISETNYLSIIANNKYTDSSSVIDEYKLSHAELNEITRKNFSVEKNECTIFEKPNFIVFYVPLVIQGHGVLATVPRGEFNVQKDSLIGLSIILVMLLTIFSLVVFLALSKKVSIPIQILSEKMLLVGQGSLETIFDVSGFKEINTINDNIQALTANIKKLLNQIKIEQENKRQADLTILQSQINPHFLYNTLYAARQLCEMHETENVIKMIDSLAIFYRIGVSKGKKIITLQEEIEHSKSYLQIQKLMHEDVFSFSIDIPMELYACEILKLSLQPLIENSLMHGIFPKRKCGNIIISAHCIHGIVYISIKDDGIGITEDTLLELQRAIQDNNTESNPKTYGLKNVHQRLQLAFGISFGLTVESIVDQGTVIIIRIPFHSKGVVEKTDYD